LNIGFLEQVVAHAPSHQAAIAQVNPEG